MYVCKLSDVLFNYFILKLFLAQIESTGFIAEARNGSLDTKIKLMVQENS